MKSLLVLLCFLTAFMATSYAQQDTNGDPDIFLPRFEIPSSPYNHFHPIILPTTSSILTILPLGDPPPPDGRKKPPPPKGVWVKPSNPTKSGTDYWEVTGTLADGTPITLTSQTYIPQGTHPEDKCEKIAKAINMASDNHTSGTDPFNAVVNGEEGRVEVTPNGDNKVSSSEFTNGSGETDNETGEIPGETPEQTGGTKNNTTFHYLFAATITGNPCGFDSNNKQSHVSFGCGKIKFSTFVDSGDNAYSVLNRFKKSLKYIGVNAKLGYEAITGQVYLVWENPYSSAPFGTNDMGLSNTIVFERTNQKLVDGGIVNIGTIMISIMSVDPDEAMPHYIPH